ncbi:hypothetical protein C1I97_08470 [Streptomyces sp. NTH33]|uniref:hypothetical protein n=1 Tax=Streptomyces sp. NTH33 TaxID=1735453 RepID=UPI000DA71C03|nr:hypothetical protein [Streptomyces sp. NTH33]PZH15356.1 hypothetical protein C1I97_08470 [Streptomyces sp. NTH33]
MTGSTPPWKRRFSHGKADPGPSDGPHGARDDERGPSRPSGTTGTAGPASLAPVSGRGDPGVPAAARPLPATRRTAAIRSRAGEAARNGVRRGGSRARAALSYLTDRIIDMAPRIPVRDLATLRRQFPGLDPEQLADRLVAGAAAASSTVGAGVGAVAMLPVPPAMTTELAAEVTGVAAIELKLIAELHEVYGVRPPGNLKVRSAVFLSSWSQERGIDVHKLSTIDAALGGRMRRRLRQRVMKRTARGLPKLTPFLVGAAVGAVMNRRDTHRLAARIRADLREIQVSWDELPALPPLDRPEDPPALQDIVDGSDGSDGSDDSGEAGKEPGEEPGR